MKRSVAILTIVGATTFGVGDAASAHEPACNGLDRAHENTHGRPDDEPGNQAEDRHHDLRDDNGCEH